jgi:hypothetical protein
MNLTPAGPPDQPELLLTGTTIIDGLTFNVTAIAVTEQNGFYTTHPNLTQQLNDLYLFGTPNATYERDGRRYVVFALSV